MLHCTCAQKTVRIDPKTHQPVRKGGKALYRLRRVGCRVYMTHEEIARQVRCSRSYASKQLRLLYDIGIIVNKAKRSDSRGESWQEFDADLCWNGAWGVWREYKKIQEGHMDTVLIFTDGTHHRMRNLQRDLDFVAWVDDEEV